MLYFISQIRKCAYNLGYKEGYEDGSKDAAPVSYNQVVITSLDKSSIHLSNGLVFDVSLFDKGTLDHWMPHQTVTVGPGKDGLYPVLIKNLVTGTSVEARKR
jgi:hypothetical protein